MNDRNQKASGRQTYSNSTGDGGQVIDGHTARLDTQANFRVFGSEASQHSSGSVGCSPDNLTSPSSLLAMIGDGIQTFNSPILLHDLMLDNKHNGSQAEVMEASDLSTGLEISTEDGSNAMIDDHGTGPEPESLLAILREAIETMESLKSVYDFMLDKGQDDDHCLVEGGRGTDGGEQSNDESSVDGEEGSTCYGNGYTST